MKELIIKIKSYLLTRFTDYDEIKAKNIDLNQDIYNLIRKDNEVEGLTTKMKWRMEFDIDDSILFGNGEDTVLTGIIISPEDKNKLKFK